MNKGMTEELDSFQITGFCCLQASRAGGDALQLPQRQKKTVH